LELVVDLHVEHVFWGWCLCKSIADVNAESNVVESGN
jgi:hypothetical protein